MSVSQRTVACSRGCDLLVGSTGIRPLEGQAGGCQGNQLQFQGRHCDGGGDGPGNQQVQNQSTCSGERYLLSHSRLLGQNITPTLYTPNPPHHLPRGNPCPNTPVNTAHTPRSVPSTWRLVAARGACRYDGIRASSWEATTYIGRQARLARRTRTSCRERLSPEPPARSSGTE